MWYVWCSTQNVSSSRIRASSCAVWKLSETDRQTDTFSRAHACGVTCARSGESGRVPGHTGLTLADPSLRSVENRHVDMRGMTCDSVPVVLRSVSHLGPPRRCWPAAERSAHAYSTCRRSSGTRSSPPSVQTHTHREISEDVCLQMESSSLVC